MISFTIATAAYVWLEKDVAEVRRAGGKKKNLTPLLQQCDKVLIWSISVGRWPFTVVLRSCGVRGGDFVIWHLQLANLEKLQGGEVKC